MVLVKITVRSWADLNGYKIKIQDHVKITVRSWPDLVKILGSEDNYIKIQLSSC